MNKKDNVLIIVLFLMVLAICGSVNYFIFTPKIAYVDTGKLLIGFSEANKIDKELKAEDDKWQVQLKQLQDSLQAAINTMSKEYDKADPAEKKELQDILSSRNQQINNFRQANLNRMGKIRQEKMQGIFEKANIYLSEYGKKHGYSMIFGTATGGSILYGDQQKYDITEDIIKGLNERYK